MKQRIVWVVANFHVSLNVDLTDWVVGVGWVWDARYSTVNVNLHVLCLTLRVAWWPHEPQPRSRYDVYVGPPLLKKDQVLLLDEHGHATYHTLSYTDLPSKD